MTDPVLVEMVELEEGIEVQWVGVYVLKWRPEWGQPTVGFREIEVESVTAEQQRLARLEAAATEVRDALRSAWYWGNDDVAIVERAKQLAATLDTALAPEGTKKETYEEL